MLNGEKKVLSEKKYEIYRSRARKKVEKYCDDRRRPRKSYFCVELSLQCAGDEVIAPSAIATLAKMHFGVLYTGRKCI